MPILDAPPPRLPTQPLATGRLPQRGGRPQRLRRSLGACALVLCVMLPAAFAAADALVNVEVRSAAGQPVDGVVVLQARGGEARYQCTTSSGNCHIDDVPGGQYTATFTPTGGAAQAPRSVMIPPAGTVSLRVAAR